MADEEDAFLSRWSRRKRDVAREEPASPGLDPEPLPEPEIEGDPEAEEEDEAALLERLGLPVPETLKEGDDFSGFMQAGVPQFLQKRALRVLWRSNPVLANLDGLNDYDNDFNAPEFTQKVLATGYQVGRGFVKKIIEGDEEAKTEPLAEEESEPAEPVAEPPKIPNDIGSVEVAEVASDDGEDTPPRPRRMRFEA